MGYVERMTSPLPSDDEITYLTKKYYSASLSDSQLTKLVMLLLDEHFKYQQLRNKLTEEKERLEHSEMEMGKVVSLSTINKQIKRLQHLRPKKEDDIRIYGQNDEIDVAVANLDDLKKEAKAAEPVAGTIQAIKQMLGLTEYYSISEPQVPEHDREYIDETDGKRKILKGRT